MGYLTAHDQRQAHYERDDAQGITLCGSLPLDLPGARPLLLTRNPLGVQCSDCLRILAAH